MDIKKGFAFALKKIRKAKKLTQEDFSDSSSRTYLSTLERGLKSPTLEKVNAIAETLEVHPLTLLTLAYVKTGKESREEILDNVKDQIRQIEKISKNS